MVSRKWLLWSGCCAWELFWLHQYVTRPVPDEGMQSVGAIIFGLYLPAFFVVFYGCWRAVYFLLKSGSK